MAKLLKKYMLIPKPLQKGDTIAISCPSGYLDIDKIQNAVQAFKEWGLNVVVGHTLSYPSLNYFSAPDDVKIHELQSFLDNPSIKAIFMGRGGYGMSRIIDSLNFDMFMKHPKWICGFSDITLLHLHLQANDVISLHSPMCTTFNLIIDEIRHENIQYLQQALLSDTPMEYSYEFSSPYVQSGTAKGRLLGGNLTILSHAIGTESMPKLDGAILFIEDIGEHIYKIDRMLYQLKRSGALKNIVGLIIGQFTDVEDTLRPFGKTWEEVIYEHFADMNIPIAYSFPAGHDDKNLSLKMGQTYILEINYPLVKLTESIK